MVSEPKGAREAVEGLVAALEYIRAKVGMSAASQGVIDRALSDFANRRPLREDQKLRDMLFSYGELFSELQSYAPDTTSATLDAIEAHLLSSTGPATAKRKCEACGGDGRAGKCSGCAGERGSHVLECVVWRKCHACGGTGEVGR